MDTKELRKLIDTHAGELMGTEFLYNLRAMLPDPTLADIPPEDRWNYQGCVCFIGGSSEEQLLISATEHSALLLSQHREVTFITELDKVIILDDAEKLEFHEIALWTRDAEPIARPKTTNYRPQEVGDYFLDRGITTDGFSDEYDREMLDGSPF